MTSVRSASSLARACRYVITTLSKCGHGSESKPHHHPPSSIRVVMPLFLVRRADSWLEGEWMKGTLFIGDLLTRCVIHICYTNSSSMF
jgi:hypothetical protein